MRELTSTYSRKEGGAARSGSSFPGLERAADAFREKLNAHACCGVCGFGDPREQGGVSMARRSLKRHMDPDTSYLLRLLVLHFFRMIHCNSQLHLLRIGRSRVF